MPIIHIPPDAIRFGVRKEPLGCPLARALNEAQPLGPGRYEVWSEVVEYIPPSGPALSFANNLALQDCLDAFDLHGTPLPAGDVVLLLGTAQPLGYADGTADFWPDQPHQGEQ